jgi:hypothetical protein
MENRMMDSPTNSTTPKASWIKPYMPVYSPSDIAQMKVPPNGVFVVDASDIVRIGAFGLDRGNHLFDYTLGWLDPMGAHSDFKNPEAMTLLKWFANVDQKDSL